LGVLTTTQHYYLQVPANTGGDPVFELFEEGASHDGKFEIPSLKLFIEFDRGDDLDVFAEVYADLWQKELEVKGRNLLAVEEAVADQIAGESKLLSLKAEEIEATLACFAERDPTGGLLEACMLSTAGARVANLPAVIEIAKTSGLIDSWAFKRNSDSGRALWSFSFVAGGEKTKQKGESDGPKKDEPVLVPIKLQRRIALAAATDVEVLKRELGGIDPKSLTLMTLTPARIFGNSEHCAAPLRTCLTMGVDLHQPPSQGCQR
jgi:hypothetical protein